MSIQSNNKPSDYLTHNGFWSTIKYDNLTAWYTTVSDNEVIEFDNSDGTQREMNSILIESESTPLYIRILPSDYCVYLPENTFRELNYQKIERVQVMNSAGVKIRITGQYY